MSISILSFIDFKSVLFYVRRERAKKKHVRSRSYVTLSLPTISVGFIFQLHFTLSHLSPKTDFSFMKQNQQYVNQSRVSLHILLVKHLRKWKENTVEPRYTVESISPLVNLQVERCEIKTSIVRIYILFLDIPLNLYNSRSFGREPLQVEIPL